MLVFLYMLLPLRAAKPHKSSAHLASCNQPCSRCPSSSGRIRSGFVDGVYPGVYVEKADFLTEEERAKIFAFNTLDLLGLKREDYEVQNE